MTFVENDLPLCPVCKGVLHEHWRRRPCLERPSAKLHECSAGAVEHATVKIESDAPSAASDPSAKSSTHTADLAASTAAAKTSTR
jgi:hypothetical protein